MYLPPFLAAYTGLVFWLLGAPDIRFGYGFICITLLLVACSDPALVGGAYPPWMCSLSRHWYSIILLYQGSLLYLSVDV